MSDIPNGQGSSTGMPPAYSGGGPSGAPPAPGPRKSAAIWVIVIVALILAAAAGTGVFLYRRSVTAAEQAQRLELDKAKADLQNRINDLEAQIASATAAATTSVVPTAAPTGTTPKPPAAPTSVKELALVKNVTWSSAKGYQVVADYVQMLTGKAAADAATAAGQESPPPNDYFILNSSSKLRTLSLPKSTAVYVLGWGGTGATTKTKIPVGQFMDIMPGGTSPQPQYTVSYYWLTVKNGTTITKIDEQFLP